MAGICRLCASFKTIDLLVPLFDSSHSIPAKVEQCCGTSLADDSDMPQTVCTGCLDVLNRNFTFAKAVTAAQSTLRKALTSRAMSISAALNSTVPANGGTVRWDTRESDDIENDLALRLRALQMHTQHISTDLISAHLGVSPAIIDKWKLSFNTQHKTEDNCEMIYEILDDSSESSNADETRSPEIVDSEIIQSASVLRIRSTQNRSTMNEIIRSVDKNASGKDNGGKSATSKLMRRSFLSRTIDSTDNEPFSNHKRADVKRWKDVPCRCVKCKEDLVGVNDLREHVRRKHTAEFDQNLYGCGLCFKMFSVFSLLIKHSLTMHVAHLRSCCFICEENLNDNRSLHAHLARHRREEKCFPCDHCGRVYTNAHNLQRHQKKRHPGINKFQCKRCAEVLENDGAFAEHVATHTTSKDVYLCTTCGYTAKLNNSIAAHSKLHNPDVKKIPCNICGTKYATMQLYEIHSAAHQRSTEGE